MTDSFYNIHGVTPLHLYPEKMLEGDYTNHCEPDFLILPCEKPDLCEVIDIFVSVSKLEQQFLRTRNKWVVHGVKKIKIMYEANTSCQSVHSANFTIPFCIVINGSRNCEIFLAVENIKVFKQDCRSLYVSTLICAIKIPNVCGYEGSYYEEHHFECSRKNQKEYINCPPRNRNECYSYQKNFDDEKCTCSKSDASHSRKRGHQKNSNHEKCTCKKKEESHSKRNLKSAKKRKKVSQNDSSYKFSQSLFEDDPW